MTFTVRDCNVEMFQFRNIVLLGDAMQSFRFGRVIDQAWGVWRGIRMWRNWLHSRESVIERREKKEAAGLTCVWYPDKHLAVMLISVLLLSSSFTYRETVQLSCEVCGAAARAALRPTAARVMVKCGANSGKERRANAHTSVRWRLNNGN